MTAIRTILTASDFSAPAKHAALRAGRLAGQTGARCVLLHVVNFEALNLLRRLVDLPGTPVEKHVMDEAHEELQRLAEEIRQSCGVAVDARLAAGPVLQEIAGHGDAIDADLLVMGARGAGNMSHLLLGSTTERMLRTTLRPLLVVKQAPQDVYRRVLVPVDFSPWSAPALVLARALAPQAELTLLHAFEVPFEGKLHYAGVADDTIEHYRIAAGREALHRMKLLAAEAGLDERAAHSVKVLRGDAASRILEQERALGCDLIGIGKHGESMLEELLFGRVTTRVLAESGCDVLVSGRD